MNAIGIRAEPSAVTFVIYDSASSQIVNAEKIKIPSALTVPESLKFVRVNLLDVLREYEVDCAGIRITESNAQRPSIGRVQIESVIVEAFASSNLKKYYCGQISNISKNLGIDRSDFKKYVDCRLVYDPVENWDSMTKLEREACLTAIGAVNA